MGEYVPYTPWQVISNQASRPPDTFLRLPFIRNIIITIEKVEQLYERERDWLESFRNNNESTRNVRSLETKVFDLGKIALPCHTEKIELFISRVNGTRANCIVQHSYFGYSLFERSTE